MLNEAALVERGRVIGRVVDAPTKGHTIEIARAWTIDGSPVSVKAFRISRGKRNLAKAAKEVTVYRSTVNRNYFEFGNDE